MRRRIGAALLGLSLLTGGLHATRAPAPDWRFAMPQIAPAEGPPRLAHAFEYRSPAGTAHAPALRILDGAASVLWFDGSREAAGDVRILAAPLELGAEAELLLERGDVAAALRPRQAVRVLGNTIQAGQGRALLATVVSLGGWAAASIVHLSMGPDGPARGRRLVLSPFLNRSHLVRAPSVAFENGDIGVPAYFEMGAVFGEFLRISPEGRVRAKRRMSVGMRAIQPMVVPLSPLRAVAFLRDFDPETDRLVAVWTEDGGQSWSDPERLALPSPDAPVAALRLSGGQILMAFNDAAARADSMDLALSSDGGRSWRRLGPIDGPDGEGDLRYPALAHLPGGDIALVYSFGSKAGIRGWRFNEPWVAAQ